jgi:hypothetical protein
MHSAPGGERSKPSRPLDPFRGPYYLELKHLRIASNGASSMFDFGTPPHVPADAVEFLLPAMVELPRVIEPYAGEG